MKFSQGHITVFFDGGCPVCRMEVRWYRRLGQRGRIVWVDIAGIAPAALPDSKSRAELLNRFHVRDLEGNWFVGIDAFARIWDETPGFRHAAFLFRTPGLRHLAGVVYRSFLAWQRRDRARREGRAASEHA